MNAKTALCMALLEGRVLNVGNCFREIGYTNIAREIPRTVEKKFDVEVSKVPKTGKNRYGDPVSYVNYRLNDTEYNKVGIERMKQYIIDNGGHLNWKVPVGRPKTIDTQPTPEPVPKKQKTLF